MTISSLFLAALLASSPDDPSEAWWQSLQALCGKAFEGVAEIVTPGDTTFADKRLVMHVRACEPDRMRIPFMVDDDRSRTWVLSRRDGRIELKHDHRHEDGSEDAVTQYGGTSPNPGLATAQIFPGDAHTAALLPAGAVSVWMIEIEPGQRFVYSARRMGTDRQFRMAFDLTREVSPPEAPWGWDGD